MSISIKCINDENKPSEVNSGEWIKKDQEYTLVFVSWHPNQKCNGCQLAEVALTEKSDPFEFYKLDRFAIRAEDLEEFLALVKDCTDMDDLSLEELLEETQIEVLENV